MSVFRISYRYANSLLQLASEKKILNKIYEDAELIYGTLAASKELRTILKNPVPKQKVKKNLLSKIFENKISTDSFVFMDFVIDKNREEILFEIYKEFLNLRDNKEGILRAKITSAISLNDELKKNIEKKLAVKTSKQIKADYSTDDKIIGGFIIKIKDTVMDASVKHQLELLRKKFYEDINPAAV